MAGTEYIERGYVVAIEPSGESMVWLTEQPRKVWTWSVSSDLTKAMVFETPRLAIATAKRLNTNAAAASLWPGESPAAVYKATVTCRFGSRGNRPPAYYASLGGVVWPRIDLDATDLVEAIGLLGSMGKTPALARGSGS